MRDNRHISVPAMIWTLLAVAVAVAVAIFVLTEQSPAVTSAESNWVNDLLIGLFGDTALYDPATGLWAGIGIRHWAHTAEFGALGLCVALATWHWTRLRPARRPALTSAAISLAICAAYSLFDQCHKLFVPGRHWDTFDLAMDALGYVLAIALVTLALLLASALTVRAISDRLPL